MQVVETKEILSFIPPDGGINETRHVVWKDAFANSTVRERGPDLPPRRTRPILGEAQGQSPKQPNPMPSLISSRSECVVRKIRGRSLDDEIPTTVGSADLLVPSAHPTLRRLGGRGILPACCGRQPQPDERERGPERRKLLID